MKKRLIALILSGIMCVTMFCGAAVPAVFAADEVSFDSQQPLRLFYDEEAPYGNEDVEEFSWGATALDDGWERWSVPLGNGYMGVNVFGRTETERLQITENSMFDYKNSVAGGLTNFAEVYMDFGHTNSAVTGYSRDLNLDEGTAHVNYTYDGVTYSRELFASYPDKVTAVKLSANRSGKVSFTLRTKIPFLEEFHTDSEGTLRGRTGTVTADTDTITLAGEYGTYKIKFEGQIKVIPEGGTVTASTDADGNGCLQIAGADSAVVLIAAGTNYPVGDSTMFTESDKLSALAKYPAPHEKVTGYMSAASAKSYAELLASHQADYKELFGRVKLNLGGAEDYSKTTDVLVDEYKAGTYSRYLEALYFQFGRYLLICSSRKGTLPPNLQGIWNRYKWAPWSGGYWHNINVQMNYWPVFSTNMAELFDCYIDYFNAYLPKSQSISKSHISSAHPGNTGLSDNPGWSIATGAYPYSIGIPTGRGTDGYGTGALMAKSFSEYYNFTMDKEKLESELYPAVLGSAIFMTKVMEPYGDKLLANPSASPEQEHNGAYYVSVGTAWDQQNAYEMHKDAVKLAGVLGKENDADVQMLKSRMDKLDPVLVGASGQVKEFREENYYGEIGEYNHRHISQLVGLYPGTIINATTPAWFDAAAVTMTERGDRSTGWAMAHRLNLWARTKRGERAYDLYRQLLSTGTNNNLWDTHPPFQIDGNLGGTSGVAEMLLQSHEGYIEPLAAIPAAWSSGSYSGLVARGNFEIAAKWADNQMQSIKVKSNAGEPCKLKYYNVASATVTASDGSSVPVTKDGKDMISFPTTKGVSYTISSIPEYTAVTAPTNLYVATEGETFEDVRLSWRASDDAVSYNVYRAEENAPDYTLVAGGITGECFYKQTLSGDSIGKQATYKVTAVGSDGRESEGTVKVLEAVTVGAPEKAIAKFVNDSTMQVTISAVEDADGYVVCEKIGDAWDECARSEYPVVVVENADRTKTYGVYAYMQKWNSEITEVAVSDGSIALEENVFLGQSISGTRSVISSFPYENALDGKTDTRYAVGDSADPYSVTIALDGTYLLDKLKIYEFKPGEGGTRSGNTTIELISGDETVTVVDGQPLNTITSNGQYTEFEMGMKPASQVKITFQNTSGNKTSATIWEIQCSGVQIDVPAISTNILVGKPISGERPTVKNMGYDLMVDGYIARDSADRMSIGDTDACKGTFSVVIDLEEAYNVYDFSIYEWGGSTRSQETTIDVSSDGGNTYKTVTDKFALTPSYNGAKKTTVSLGGETADHIRINFKNTKDVKSATIYEVECSGVRVADINTDNLLLGLQAESTVAPMSAYGVDKLTDGNIPTGGHDRFAICDGVTSDGSFTLTYDLGKEQLLDALKIYEFKPDEGGTRSEETTVEVFGNDTWTTVIDKQPLNIITANGQCTEFKLGYAKALKLRITFTNTDNAAKTASIWEINCTGASIAGNSDKSALYYALLLASTVDTTGFTEDELAKWKEAVTAAETVMNNDKAIQSKINSAAETLKTLALSHGGIMPEAPVAKDVKISGDAEEYKTLTIDYTFSDVNGDKEKDSKYIWQVSDDGESWADISDATEKTYDVPNKYVGKYIRGLVKPKADAEPANGVYTASEKAGPIAISSDYESFGYTDLILEHTKTVLAKGETSQLHITGTSDRGGVYDITGHSKVSYTSSDEVVAKVSESGLITAGREGVSIITATFENTSGDTAQGKIAVAVHNGNRNYQSFESMSFNESVDTHVKAVTSPVNTGDYALKLSKLPSDSASSLAKWGRWDIYRSTDYTASMVLQGWFYDSGEMNDSAAYIYFQAHDKDQSGNVIPCTGQYNIGYINTVSNTYYSVNSAAGNRIYEKTGTNCVGAGNVNRALDGSEGFAAMPRSRGWHQVMFVSTGDSEDMFTDKGTVNIYLDGELVFTENYVNATMNVAAGKAVYDLPAHSYYDDLAIMRYVSTKPVTVTYNEGGTVSVNGAEVTSGVTAEIDTANGVTVTAEPDEGYEARFVVNGVPYIASESLALSNVTEDLDIKVTFVEMVETAPSADMNPEFTWFRSINGVPTIYVYAKINQFWPYSSDFEYGIRIGKSGSNANPISLAAMDSKYGRPAKAVPGTAYAIKVYGDAISEDGKYTVNTYIGDAEGEETELSFEN